jgi:hypothetical protein
MSDPERDLVTTEGVDEGSAASTVEGPASGASPAAGAGPLDGPGAPAASPPVDMETEESRAVREREAPGQQLQAGEG